MRARIPRLTARETIFFFMSDWALLPESRTGSESPASIATRQTSRKFQKARSKLPVQSKRLARLQRPQPRGQIEPRLQLTVLIGAAHHHINGGLRGADPDGFDFRPIRRAQFVLDLQFAAHPFEIAAEIKRRRFL